MSNPKMLGYQKPYKPNNRELRRRIDCCNGCKPPKRNPYCHIPGNCPEYTKQRAELDEANEARNIERTTAESIIQQKCKGVARATRKRRR